ncbi:MAG TPA: hypothetical protein VE619_07595 [Nitrososphaeraceae archaeon]|nr:hypothetical protein [Nitrososphaeraceae archaeon]
MTVWQTVRLFSIVVKKIQFKLNIHFVLVPYGVLSGNNNAFAFSILIFTFAITIIIIIFRVRKVVQGTKVSVKKTIIFSAYYLAIASFLVYNSFLIGSVPFTYAVPYCAVVVASGYGSYKYSKRILSFWKLSTNGDENSSSTIYVNGGLAIYLLYVAALIVRITINFIFIGSEKFYFNNQEAILENSSSSAILIMQPLIHTDSATTLLAFTATDFLLMVGAGLLIGRNARILKYYYQDKKRAMYEKR